MDRKASLAPLTVPTAASGGAASAAAVDGSTIDLSLSSGGRAPSVPSPISAPAPPCQSPASPFQLTSRDGGTGEEKSPSNSRDTYSSSPSSSSSSSSTSSSSTDAMKEDSFEESTKNTLSFQSSNSFYRKPPACPSSSQVRDALGIPLPSSPSTSAESPLSASPATVPPSSNTSSTASVNSSYSEIEEMQSSGTKPVPLSLQENIRAQVN